RPRGGGLILDASGGVAVIGTPVRDGPVGGRSSTCETGSVSQLAFDQETGKQLEALYRIGDAVRRRRLVRAALAVKPGERVLGVGCGPGFYCAELLEEVGPDGSIVGLDSSASMLALAARRCEGHRNVRFDQADATCLPV